ncbi:hypothetical protein DMJ13_21300 [halophilic archaeon]|nr:hypothetical protein DMJ13_21300 [halophilic archaeon]
MTASRCPHYKTAVAATVVLGPSTIVVQPCGYDIASESQLIEPGDLSHQRPDEWLVELLADTADD